MAHFLNFPREDPKAKRGPSPGQVTRKRGTEPTPATFPGCERLWRLAPPCGWIDENRAELRFGKSGLSDSTAWGASFLDTGRGLSPITQPRPQLVPPIQYLSPTPDWEHPRSTVGSDLSHPLDTLGRHCEALRKWFELNWIQCNGRKSRMWTKIMHRTAHQIHVCKSKIALMYCWSG